MSIAPGKQSGSDFLQNLPDTGYRPPQQAQQNRIEPEVAAEAIVPPELGSHAVLMSLLSLLAREDTPTTVPELETRSAEMGVDTLAFYRALTTLLESDLARKDARGVSPTEAGRKVAAFSAS